MKSSLYLRTLLVFLLLFLIFSCLKDKEYETENSIFLDDSDLMKLHEGQMVLGKQLKNPYSIKNMEKALESLKASFGEKGQSVPSIGSISPTHYYIKFRPKTKEEFDLLESDTTLILYDFPLDYEILKDGHYYHDPKLPLDQPTYQYASVPVQKSLSSTVDYEILEELYIPDEDTNLDNTGTQKLSSEYDAFIEALVDKSLLLTDNLDEDTKVQNNIRNNSQTQHISIETPRLFKQRRKWRPAGTIKVWDDNIGNTVSTRRVFSHWEYYYCEDDDFYKRYNEHDVDKLKRIDIEEEQCKRAIYKNVTTTASGSFIPIEGVKIRARRWFTTYTGITNSQGYYSCNGRFKRRANYKIKWKRHDFSIRWSWLSAAKYNGPKKKGDWNLNIKGGSQEYYATIFRAAHHYYYKNIKRLRRPPQNSFGRTQMKIRAYKRYVSKKGSLGTHNSSWRAFGLWSPVKIYTYGGGAIETYSTVIHELTHASHWNMGRRNFRNADRKLKESWARGVEWELTRMVYPSFRAFEIRPNYTLVAMDMIDNDNRFGNTFTLGESVKGYSIRQIEDALIGKRNWNDWKNNIKNKYSNETEKNLDALFTYWN